MSILLTIVLLLDTKLLGPPPGTTGDRNGAAIGIDRTRIVRITQKGDIDLKKSVVIHDFCTTVDRNIVCLNRALRHARRYAANKLVVTRGQQRCSVQIRGWGIEFRCRSWSDALA